MPTPRSAWLAVQLSSGLATTSTLYAAPGVTGNIMAITAGVPAVATAGTLDVKKNGSNVATQVDLSDGLVAGEADELTLTTDKSLIKVLPTDIFSVVLTITTAGSFVGGAVTLWIEPNVW